MDEKYLTRNELLNGPDAGLVVEEVVVPEWGGKTVRVSSMSAADRDAFEESIIVIDARGSRARNFENVRAKLVARSLVDENGNRLLSEADVAALGRRSASAVQRLFEVAQRLSGLTTEHVEELVKNSESGQSEPSASDSPLI